MLVVSLNRAQNKLNPGQIGFRIHVELVFERLEPIGPSNYDQTTRIYHDCVPNQVGFAASHSIMLGGLYGPSDGVEESSGLLS